MVFGYKAPEPCLVLIQGNKMVDIKKLATVLQVSPRKVKPADHEYATRFTGYQFGGTSPFGNTVRLVTFMDEAIEREIAKECYINGGSRNLNLRIDVASIRKAIDVTVHDLSKV